MFPYDQRQVFAPPHINGSYNRIQNSRSITPINHRVIGNSNGSPRWMTEGRISEIQEQTGQKMRMMKSKIANISIQQRNGINQSNLYPAELIFLLSNENGNVEHIRKLIQSEKKRVDRDFDNFVRTMIHIIEDLKSSIYAQLNSVFMNFMELYKNMKDQVVRMKENRRRIIENLKRFQPQAKSTVKSQIINNTNNISNLNILQQISRDEDYYRHHRMYEEISNAYYEAIGPILSDVQNILVVGSEVQFYNDEECKKLLDDIHNRFYEEMKQIYDKKLNILVTQVSNLIQENNMLLKGLNIDDIKPEKIQDHFKINQLLKSPKTNNINNQQSKKRRFETEASPYGLEQSTQKNRCHFIDQQNIKYRNTRPTSSVDNLRVRGRNSQFQSVNHREMEQIKRKPAISKVNSLQLKTTRDQQNVILQWAQSASMIKKDIEIASRNSQDILLCVIFINDGKHIAIGSKDNNIYIHEVSTGKFIQVLLGHQASVCSLFNFKNFFASGGDSGCGSLILWQSDQFRMKKKINLHSAALTCIVDLTDGANLATAGYDKKINIFNYKKGQLAFELNSCRSGITSMIVCQQSRKLVSSGLDSTLSIWNISIQNRELQNITLERIITNCGFVCSLRPLTLLPDMILVGNKEGKVMLVNMYSGESIKTLTIGRGSVIEMAVIQRGNKNLYPIVLSCCSGEKELFMTKLDTGITQSSKVRNNVSYGCGIGPKLVIDAVGTVAIVSQTVNEKQVDLYEFSIK